MNTTTSPSAGRMLAAIGLLAIGGIFAGASGAKLSDEDLAKLA